MLQEDSKLKKLIIAKFGPEKSFYKKLLDKKNKIFVIEILKTVNKYFKNNNFEKIQTPKKSRNKEEINSEYRQAKTEYNNKYDRYTKDFQIDKYKKRPRHRFEKSSRSKKNFRENNYWDSTKQYFETHVYNDLRSPSPHKITNKR